MRVIILVLGMVTIDLFNKHFGLSLGTQSDSETVFKYLLFYAFILDIVKK